MYVDALHWPVAFLDVKAQFAVPDFGLPSANRRGPVLRPEMAALAAQERLCDSAATNRRMPTQDITRPVFIPVIIGTPRQGRLTEPAANFVFGEVSKWSDIETELIDIRKIPIRMDDEGEALKDSEF